MSDLLIESMIPLQKQKGDLSQLGQLEPHTNEMSTSKQSLKFSLPLIQAQHRSGLTYHFYHLSSDISEDSGVCKA